MNTPDSHVPTQNNATPKSNSRFLPGLISGFILGAVALAVTAYLLLPGMMITVHESKLGFDETVAKLQENIKAEGWVVQGTTDMQKSLAKHGEKLDKRVTGIKLCQPSYARSVLETDREMAALMPCSIAVWEGDDGKVYLSKMNTGLMGTMFGGNVADVMGGKVAADEKKILSDVTR